MLLAFLKLNKRKDDECMRVPSAHMQAKKKTEFNFKTVAQCFCPASSWLVDDGMGMAYTLNWKIHHSDSPSSLLPVIIVYDYD